MDLKWSDRAAAKEASCTLLKWLGISLLKSARSEGAEAWLFSSEWYEWTNLPIWYSFSWGETFSTEQTTKKCMGQRWFAHFIPSKCSVSTPHVRSIGCTWVNFGLTRPQVGPNPGPLGPNFGRNLAPTWPREQLRRDLKLTWPQNGRPGRLNTKSSKHPFSLVFRFFSLHLKQEAMFPMLCPRWAQTWCRAVVTGPQVAHCTWYRFNVGLIWIAAGPTSA